MPKKLFQLFGIAVITGLLLAANAKGENPVDRLAGEKITYSIKKFGVKAGTAVLHFVGPAEVKGQKVFLIIFRATGFNFLDEEKIYADPLTLLPLQIERNLNIFGSKERIVEYYSSGPPQVRVVKRTEGKTAEMLLKSDQVVDNIYCFIARYRLQGQFKPGEVLALNLPTQRVEIVLKDQQRIAAAGKNYEAYFLQSRPAKYRLWFDSKEGKLPLRIDGTSRIGPTVMIMQKYEGPQ